MTKTAAVLVVAAVFVAAGCGSGSTAQSTSRPSPGPTRDAYVTVGGVQRVWIRYRPPSADPHQALPLVIAMHGYQSYTGRMETTSHFDDLAAQNGLEVVYPEGIDNSWNAGRCCGQAGSDDVAFIKALITKLVAAGEVDRTRVFATGKSNGGMMAQRLACELANQITAVASVSGSMVLDTCSPSRPISVLEMHGIDDDIVPFKGGTVAGLTYFAPTVANMQAWANRDGCAASPAMTEVGITSIYTWSHCPSGVTVVLQAIAGAGHEWFSPDNMAGEPDASKTAWLFFQQAPRLT